MNPDAPRTPREELEIKITALLMGQLAPEEAAEVEAQIAADAELAALHTRLARAAELLREARALKDVPTPGAPLQLSKERREQLLAKFRGIKPLPAPPKPLSRPARPHPHVMVGEIAAQPRARRTWARPLILAASIAALIVVPIAFFAPASSRMRAPSYAAKEAPPASRDAGHSLLHVIPRDGAMDFADMPAPSVKNEVSTAYYAAPALPASPTIKLEQAASSPRLSNPLSSSSSSGEATGWAAQPGKIAGVYLPSTAPDDQSPPAESTKREGQGTGASGLQEITVNRNGLADAGGDASRWRSETAGEKPSLFSIEPAPANGTTALRGGVLASDGRSDTVDRELRRRYARQQLAEDEAKRLGASKDPVPHNMGNVPLGSDPLAGLAEIPPRLFSETPRGEALPLDAIKDAETTANPRGAVAFFEREMEEAAKEGSSNRSKLLGSGGEAGTNRFGSTKTEEGKDSKPADSAEGRADLGIVVGADAIRAKELRDSSPEQGREVTKSQTAERDGVAARSEALRDVSSFWERSYRRTDLTPAQPASPASGDVSGVARKSESQGIAAGASGTEPNFALGLGGVGEGKNYWHYSAQAAAEGTKSAGDRVTAGLGGAEGFGLLPGSMPGGSAARHYDVLDGAKLGGVATGKPQGAGGQPADVEWTADPNRPASAISEPLATAGIVRLDGSQLTPQAAPASELAFPATPANPGARPDGERAGGGRTGTRAEPAQETFVNGFLAVRKAEELAAAGENQKALELYRGASDKLASIKQQWPDWQPELVEFRKKRTEESIAKLQEKLEKAEKAAGAKADAKPASGPATEPPATPKAAEPPPVPQPEVSTKENAFSTFSLNVSDVSFQLAAASLEKGKMPEAATVRSEEFINALDYRDPEPAGSAPLAFTSERARYPFAHNRDLLRLSVKTAAAGRAPGRPLNLVLLIDNSGSMERADRVGILKESMRVLTQQLKPEDKLSLITFSRTPRLWADGVAGDKAAEAALRASEITPQGGTDLSAALDLGYKTALKHYKTGSINRVVLLTDGAANLGEVKAETLKTKVEAHRKQGVAFDCFGVGWEGYNDDLLEQLSRNGDGRYGFINTQEAAAKEFAGQLAGALRVAASDVKVQVEFNPRRVNAYRQIGYAKHQLKKEQFRDNTVDAAEIGAAESGNALYVLEVNAGGSGDIGIARARFKVPGTTEYRELEWTIPFQAPAPAIEQASSSLRLAATASAFSEWLAQSPYAAEVTTDRLLALINGIPAIYGADRGPAKLEAMIRQAKSISGR